MMRLLQNRSVLSRGALSGCNFGPANAPVALKAKSNRITCICSANIRQYSKGVIYCSSINGSSDISSSDQIKVGMHTNDANIHDESDKGLFHFMKLNALELDDQSGNKENRKKKNDELNNLKHLLEKYIKAKQIDEAYKLFDSFLAFQEENTSTNDNMSNKSKKSVQIIQNVQSLLFSCFCESHHLPYALKLFEELTRSEKDNKKLYMAASVSLIRCYSKSGDIDKALNVINDLSARGFDIKFRLYYPILEAIKNTGDVYAVLDLIIRSILHTDHNYRANHISLLLETAAKSGSLGDRSITATIESFLQLLSKDLNPFSFSNLVDINSYLNNTTREAVLDNGIYVGGIEALEKELASQSLKITVDERKKGFVFAEDRQLLIDEVSSGVASDNGVVFNKDENDLNQSIIQKFTFRRKPIVEGKEGRPTKAGKIVRIFDDHSSSQGVPCECPHCFASLSLTSLNSFEKESIRCSFIKQISGFHSGNFEEFLSFEAWLQKRKPFDYFIDGCNLGYANQNFKPGGAFNVGQIKGMVEYIKKIGGNPCILLPRRYTDSETYYDSLTNSLKRMSSTDRQDIWDWINEGSLYSVPNKIHDDLYCMYATVSPASQDKAVVVTNDLLRNHIYAFAGSSIFKKWRENHSIGYNIKYPDGDFKYTGAKEYSIESQSLNKSRSIQRSSNGYWHIPALDRNAWLCFKLNSTSSRSKFT